MSIEEVGLKAELWRVVVLQGEVFRGLQKCDVHVLLLKKKKKISPGLITFFHVQVFLEKFGQKVYILSVVT